MNTLERINAKVNAALAELDRREIEDEIRAKHRANQIKNFITSGEPDYSEPRTTGRLDHEIAF
jgi:hypothetical protein